MKITITFEIESEAEETGPIVALVNHLTDLFSEEVVETPGFRGVSATMSYEPRR